MLRQSAYGDLYPFGMLPFQNVDSSRRPHTFTSAHSEKNEAEIHCLRRPGGWDENRSFMNIPAARSKLAVSSAEWFRQAVEICGRRLLPSLKTYSNINICTQASYSTTVFLYWQRTVPFRSSGPSGSALISRVPPGCRKIRFTGCPVSLASQAPAAVVPLAQEFSQKSVSAVFT